MCYVLLSSSLSATSFVLTNECSGQLPSQNGYKFYLLIFIYITTPMSQKGWQRPQSTYHLPQSLNTSFASLTFNKFITRTDCDGDSTPFVVISLTYIISEFI